VYSHIIVPFDGDESSRRAAGVGADLSRLFDNRLVIVTATPASGGAEVQALKDRAQAMSDERVDVWIEPNNKPVDAIATTVRFRPRALLCMFTHARQGVRRAVYGSIAEAVIARVEIPVVLLGPNYPGGEGTDIRQLVVCIDESATSQSVIPLAALWAQYLQLPCTLLHIDSPGGGGEVRRRRGPDLDSMRALLERSSPRVEIVAEQRKDVAAGILDMCTPSSRALAVMSTHEDMGRSSAGIEVMKVVERAQVPVLIERAGAKRPAPLSA
jgi:nucleotide-binding universal stress UspA family protein